MKYKNISITSKERVNLCIKGEKTDRVPVNLQNCTMAIESTGKKYNEVCRNGELLASGTINQWKEFKHDAVVLDIGTHAAAEAFGCISNYPENFLPSVKEPILSDLERINTIKIPDPWNTFPLTVMLDAVKKVKNEIGHLAFIIASLDQGPFTLSAELRKMDRFLIDIVDRENIDLIKELLDVCVKFTTSYAIALKESGADMVRLGDSFSGGTVISPSMYEEFAYPYQKKISENLKKEGILHSIHICGNATKILDKFTDIGTDVIEVDEKTDSKKVKELCLKKGICAMGQISPTLMKFGKKEEVEQNCKEYLEFWMPDKALLFGPGCTLAGDTPYDNVHCLINCVKSYGVYK